MKTEKIIYKENSRCINVSANQVTSLRINNSVENSVRVYDNGFIGVDGTLGTANFAEMEKAAQAKLQQGIAYPETHDKKVVLNIDTTKDILKEEEFVEKIQHLVSRIAEENPDFLFSNKVLLNSCDTHYENSDGTSLSYKGNNFDCGLVIKSKGSANIMDEFYSAESDYFDEAEIARDVKIKCDAFAKTLPQIEGDEAVIIGEFEPLQYLINHFVADLYFNKASLLDGKLGEKVFNDKLNVTVNRNPAEKLNIPFYDAEGVVNYGYINYIVKNGVISHLITCKKSATQYSVENLGAASASYNGVPSDGARGLSVENTAENLSEIVHGSAIVVSMTGGGDMTPSGDFSLPVIVSYLYQDGKLVGRLPEFTVTANIFDILGKDFVGVAPKGIFEFGRRQHFVYKAKLVNKK